MDVVDRFLDEGVRACGGQQQLQWYDELCGVRDCVSVLLQAALDRRRSDNARSLAAVALRHVLERRARQQDTRQQLQHLPALLTAALVTRCQPPLLLHRLLLTCCVAAASHALPAALAMLLDSSENTDNNNNNNNSNCNNNNNNNDVRLHVASLAARRALRLPSQRSALQSCAPALASFALAAPDWPHSRHRLRLLRCCAALGFIPPLDPLLRARSPAALRVVLAAAASWCPIAQHRQTVARAAAAISAQLASLPNLHDDDEAMKLFKPCCRLLAACKEPNIAVPAAFRLLGIPRVSGGKDHTQQLWAALLEQCPAACAHFALAQMRQGPSVALCRALAPALEEMYEVAEPARVLAQHLDLLKAPDTGRLVGSGMLEALFELTRKWVACVPAQSRPDCCAVCVRWMRDASAPSAVRQGAALTLTTLLADVSCPRELRVTYVPPTLREIVCVLLASLQEEEEDSLLAILDGVLRLVELRIAHGPIYPIVQPLCGMLPHQHPLVQSLMIRILTALFNTAYNVTCDEPLLKSLLPILHLCLRGGEKSAYLLEEGLALWNAVVRSSVALSAPLLALIPALTDVISASLDHYAVVLHIADAYACLAADASVFEGAFATMFERVVSSIIGPCLTDAPLLHCLSFVRTVLLVCPQLVWALRGLLVPRLLHLALNVPAISKAARAAVIALVCRLWWVSRDETLLRVDLMEAALSVDEHFGPGPQRVAVCLYCCALTPRVASQVAPLAALYLVCLTCDMASDENDDAAVAAAAYYDGFCGSGTQAAVEMRKQRILASDTILRAPVAKTVANTMARYQNLFGRAMNIDRTVESELKSALAQQMAAVTTGIAGGCP